MMKTNGSVVGWKPVCKAMPLKIGPSANPVVNDSVAINAAFLPPSRGPNRTNAMFAAPARYGLRHDEDRLLVDGDDVVPVLLRKFGERVAALDTGVVDQDVYRADVRFDTVDGGMHRLGVGDVERRRIGAQPLFTQAIGGVPGMFFGGGVDQNMRALLCQAARQQKTNAARGTSD